MEHTDAEVARVLSALQGRFAGHSIHQQSRPSSPSRGAGAGGEAKVWVIPAGVGSDLTRPATLAALVEQWGQLDEAQKINALLGVAHVGQSKMQRVRGSVERLGELARADGSSDWVRALGHTLGSVGVTGKMAALEELPEGSAVRAELDAAVSRLHAAALARLPELRLAAGVLPCVGARVAAATAPPAIRHVYGAPPSARRHFARGADAALEGLFGDSASDGDSDAAESEPEPPAARLALRVRSSHRADHAGRMARLLAAAAEPPPVSAAIGGAAAGPRRPSLGVARSSASASAAAAAAAGGPGAGGPAGGGASKIGMFAPRRRAAPTNAALPGSGLGSVPAARRGSEKKIMLTDSLDTEVMNARDTLLQERRERAIEEREAKRVKRQAEVDERKRKRVEAAEKKKAAAEGRRSPPAKRGRPPRGAASRAKSRDGSPDDDDDASGNDDGGEGGGEDNATSPPSRSARASPSPAPSAQPTAYVPPLEYRTYAGNDATTRAIYADTNALTDQGRMQLYCFFNAYPRPPDTPQEVSVVLNERIVDDSSTSGKVRREITALSVDFASGKWEKKRLYRRIQ
ncbi:hypothetical protein GGI00_001048 [Coemansia sp. RSA 2681]|nr:hypothetical protein GGI00_001048 [Coemansia sp. RSA 2681]